MYVCMYVKYGQVQREITTSNRYHWTLSCCTNPPHTLASSYAPLSWYIQIAKCFDWPELNNQNYLSPTGSSRFWAVFFSTDVPVKQAECFFCKLQLDNRKQRQIQEEWDTATLLYTNITLIFLSLLLHFKIIFKIFPGACPRVPQWWSRIWRSQACNSGL